MLETDITSLAKYFNNISYKTNAYNSQDIRNSMRDEEMKKIDLLSDS